MGKMNDDIFRKWNSTVDKGSIDEVKNMENSQSGDYDEVPCGKYAVKIDKLELVSSKNGSPMVCIWMKIIEGQYKNRLLFANQVVDEPFKIHRADEMLRQLLDDTESNIEVEWVGDYRKYATMIDEIFMEIKDSYTYDVEYGKTNKGFSTYTFTDTYEN